MLDGRSSMRVADAGGVDLVQLSGISKAGHRFLSQGRKESLRDMASQGRERSHGYVHRIGTRVQTRGSLLARFAEVRGCAKGYLGRDHAGREAADRRELSERNSAQAARSRDEAGTGQRLDLAAGPRGQLRF